MPQEKLKRQELSTEEMSFVDLAYQMMFETRQPFYFYDLVHEITKRKGMTEEEVSSYLPMLYTDMNVDGRFTSTGNNLWGLQEWYPFDTSEEDMLAIEAFQPEEEEVEEPQDLGEKIVYDEDDERVMEYEDEEEDYEDVYDEDHEEAQVEEEEDEFDEDFYDTDDV